MTQQQLAEKADLVLANIQSNGGLLSPQQSNTFFEILMEQPTILRVARTVQMTAPEMKIPKIGLGTRILRRAVENTALAAADRSKPDFGQVDLKTKELIAEVRIGYAALEDNIERGGLENTLLRLIGKRAAVDLEELIIQGDTANGTDNYLSVLDGLVKRVTSREVDVQGMGVTPRAFSAGLKLLPERYKKNKAALRLFATHGIEEDYRQTLGDRQTALGDAQITGSGVAQVQGVPIVPVSYMPGGKVILTDPQNLIIGIQRDFRLESARIIDARQIQIVLTIRVDFNLETEDAAVQYDNMAAIDPDDDGSGTGA